MEDIKSRWFICFYLFQFVESFIVLVMVCSYIVLLAFWQVEDFLSTITYYLLDFLGILLCIAYEVVYAETTVLSSSVGLVHVTLCANHI